MSKQVNVLFSDQQYESLRKLAWDSRTSVAAVVRIRSTSGFRREFVPEPAGTPAQVPDDDIEGVPTPKPVALPPMVQPPAPKGACPHREDVMCTKCLLAEGGKLLSQENT